MQGYAGVMAWYDGELALVWERYEAWDTEYWNLPSGAIEDGETPASAAVRELREESGLRADAAELKLIWTTRTEVDGRPMSRSWNYSVQVTDPTFDVNDPDGSVLEVRWFTPEDALRALEQLPYPPIAAPAVHYLTTGEPGHEWTFTQIAGHWTS